MITALYVSGHRIIETKSTFFHEQNEHRTNETGREFQVNGLSRLSLHLSDALDGPLVYNEDAVSLGVSET